MSRALRKLFADVRKICGDEVELLHDIHGELHPVECIDMISRIEPYRPYFIEDPSIPEDIGFMPDLRQATTVPIALGEKFVNKHEFVDFGEGPADRLHPHPPVVRRRNHGGSPGGDFMRMAWS